MKSRHGHRSNGKVSPTYQSWNKMKERCNNKNNTSYSRYGGAGIKVCERWDSFENFLEDMGVRPERKTLDRFPNDRKIYCKENCRWATYLQQNINRGSQKVKNGTSKYKGVCWNKSRTKPWRVQIQNNGKKKTYGYFKTEEEAALAYNKAAYELWGEDVLLNVIPLQQQEAA